MARIPKPSQELAEALRREQVVLRAFQMTAGGMALVQVARALRVPAVNLRRWMASFEKSGGNVQSLQPRRRRVPLPPRRRRKKTVSRTPLA